jgi:hypothetical protein
MDEAEARKAKLQALKERAKRAREGGGEGEDAGPTLKFRNYQPKTEELKDGMVEPVKVSADKELEKMGAVSVHAAAASENESELWERSSGAAWHTPLHTPLRTPLRTPLHRCRYLF